MASDDTDSDRTIGFVTPRAWRLRVGLLGTLISLGLGIMFLWAVGSTDRLPASTSALLTGANSKVLAVASVTAKYLRGSKELKMFQEEIERDAADVDPNKRRGMFVVIFGLDDTVGIREYFEHLGATPEEARKRAESAAHDFESMGFLYGLVKAEQKVEEILETAMKGLKPGQHLSKEDKEAILRALSTPAATGDGKIVAGGVLTASVGSSIADGISKIVEQSGGNIDQVLDLTREIVGETLASDVSPPPTSAEEEFATTADGEHVDEDVPAGSNRSSPPNVLDEAPQTDDRNGGNVVRPTSTSLVERRTATPFWTSPTPHAAGFEPATRPFPGLARTPQQSTWDLRLRSGQSVGQFRPNLAGGYDTYRASGLYQGRSSSNIVGGSNFHGASGNYLGQSRSFGNGGPTHYYGATGGYQGSYNPMLRGTFNKYGIRVR